MENDEKIGFCDYKKLTHEELLEQFEKILNFIDEGEKIQRELRYGLETKTHIISKDINLARKLLTEFRAFKALYIDRTILDLNNQECESPMQFL